MAGRTITEEQKRKKRERERERQRERRRNSTEEQREAERERLREMRRKRTEEEREVETQRINHYPVDSVVCFVNTFSAMESSLSSCVHQAYLITLVTAFSMCEGLCEELRF